MAIRYGQAHHRVATVADTLRAGLQPQALPVVPGVDLAARYRRQSDEVDGDFYDIFPLRHSGRESTEWGFAIRDITGSGAPAATWTSLIPHTLQTAAMIDPDPVHVIGLVNRRLLHSTDGHRLSTAVFGRLTRADAAVRVCLVRAGHPYPLLVRGDASLEVLQPPGPLLGLTDDPHFGVATVRLPPLTPWCSTPMASRAGTEQFGLRRLVDTVRAAAGGPAASL